MYLFSQIFTKLPTVKETQHMKHCIFVVRKETKQTGTSSFRKENKFVIDLFFVCLGDTAKPGSDNKQINSRFLSTSVADPDPNPDPDPPDPHVFGPPGSGSPSQRYGSGSGSGSFYHRAKIVRKTLIPTIL
jgi:hypothetical protein